MSIYFDTHLIIKFCKLVGYSTQNANAVNHTIHWLCGEHDVYNITVLWFSAGVTHSTFPSPVEVLLCVLFLACVLRMLRQSAVLAGSWNPLVSKCDHAQGIRWRPVLECHLATLQNKSVREISSSYTWVRAPLNGTFTCSTILVILHLKANVVVPYRPWVNSKKSHFYKLC